MRIVNRLSLSLLVPLLTLGQSAALAQGASQGQPYSKTFNITGKEGGGYSITAIVKPQAGTTALPMSVIPDGAQKAAPAGTADQGAVPNNQPPPGNNQPNDKPQTAKGPEQGGPQTPQQTQQQIEDMTKQLAEQLKKQQEELAQQLQKQQQEMQKQLAEQQQKMAEQLAKQQEEANQRLAQQQQQANQQLAQQQQQNAQQMANNQQRANQQLAQQQQQALNQLNQQAQQMAAQQQQQQQQMAQQMRRQQQQLGRLFAQARRDQMMRNFERQMYGDPMLANQMSPNNMQGIMGLVNQLMAAASQMAQQMRGGQGQGAPGQDGQAMAQQPSAQEIAKELQQLIGDKLSTEAAQKVLTALKDSMASPNPQTMNDEMKQFTELGNKIQSQDMPQAESPSRVSSAGDTDLAVDPNDYEKLAALADKLGKGDARMTKQFLEMSLDAAGRVSIGKSYSADEKKKAREFAMKLVTRFRNLKEQVGSGSASDRSMRSALEFDIDKCVRINNEVA